MCTIGSFSDWGGHVHRISMYDPNRLTPAVLHFKNFAWIQHVSEETGGDQCHGCRLRTWRWEHPLYQFFRDRGVPWEQVAANKVEWTALLDAMVSWRSNHR